MGLSVSHSEHHKHSYYLIRHSDRLSGFTDHEIELIAQIARYHRKSEPKAKHAEFARLRASDQHRVKVLAGLLRIGIALDRSHAGHVAGVDAETRRKRLVLRVHPVPGADIGLELHTAEERKRLLEHVLERQIEIVGD